MLSQKCHLLQIFWNEFLSFHGLLQHPSFFHLTSACCRSDQQSIEAGSANMHGKI